MLLLLKILGGLLALGFGVWLGMPGRYEQTADELDQLMEKPGGRTRKVKRHFTPLAWFQRKAPPKRRPTGRARFHLSTPGEND
jgi:hypothetical protein